MSELSDAITAAQDREAGDRPGGELATIPGGLEAFGPLDPVRILQIIGLNPADPRAHAVVAVAERYGLDPVLGHILILPKSNRPYITRDGYLHIAHRSQQFDGMEVVDGPRRDGSEREWTARVSIWRRDMSRPFTFPGRAALTLDNGPEMALARAERRALRRAFDVTLPPVFAEDEYDDRPLPPQAAPPHEGEAPAPPLTDAQRKAIMAGFREVRVSNRSDRIALMRRWADEIRIGSVKDLTSEQADAVLAGLAALADERRQAFEAQAAANPSAGPDDDSGEGEAAQDAEQSAPAPITRDQRNQIGRLLKQAGITGTADAMNLISGWAGREVTTTAQLAGEEIATVIENAQALTSIASEDPADDADA